MLKFFIYIISLQLITSQFSYTEHYIQKDDGQIIEDPNYGQISQQQNIDDSRQLIGNGLLGGLSGLLGKKDPNLPQTYPYLGVSYRVDNPPYSTVRLVPIIEEKEPRASKVSSGYKEIKKLKI